MTAVRERELAGLEEADVDLGRYGRTLADRWWLPLAGLLAGAIVGYLLSLGGGTVYRAQALVYLGQPLGPGGGGAVQSPNTNPSTARAIVRSESVVQQVAHDVKLPPAKLRGNVSATPVSGASAKLNQIPLIQVTVKSSKPAKARAAANELAQIVVNQLSGYSRTKIRTLSEQLASDRAAIDAMNAGIANPKASFDTKLLLQIQLAQRQSDATQTEQLLSVARNVESPRILARAAASKTTARSHRNSTAVGALIGLILGGIAALLWDPLVERRRVRR